ncbi:purine/pyrimidine permease [Paenibacillus sp. N1-5-1-14]|uniref:purine/pyrimidine permease n=1 Tax=Paenibacillus radicibacter TaxID=2972488 RepID=UPI002158A9FA|nr:purine/pyrimidine permease [Paenibacillus radicibacter]MCR8643750.1 purine/pyrimidine permease [Paenibacillus radicibacter]
MKVFFSSFQWVVFILAGSLVAPIAAGHAFGLPPEEISSLMQRTFLLIGISGLLQTVFGHRLPLMENPAGLWWGVFTVYAGLIASGTLGLSAGLQQLEMGMIIAGVLFAIVALFKWTEKITKLFTPLVVGTYLILLVAQLSGSFMKGMMGIGYLDSTEVNLHVAVPSILTLFIAMILPRVKITFFRNNSILLSLAMGWILFILFGVSQPQTPVSTVFSAPKPFEWGMPVFDSGILVTSIFISLLLLTNMITSIKVTADVVKSKGGDVKPIPYNRTTAIMGVNSVLGGVFSAMGCVPISGTAGFILTTGIFQRLPFIIASVFMMGISFFPPLTAFFSSIPMPVGYATIFVPFASMFALGLKEYSNIELNDNNKFILGTSLMIGIGCMFIPASAIGHLPGLLRTVANNGLIMGMVTCIVLEQVFRLTGRKKVVKSN